MSIPGHPMFRQKATLVIEPFPLYRLWESRSLLSGLGGLNIKVRLNGISQFNQETNVWAKLAELFQRVRPAMKYFQKCRAHMLEDS